MRFKVIEVCRKCDRRVKAEKPPCCPHCRHTSKLFQGWLKQVTLKRVLVRSSFFSLRPVYGWKRVES